MHRFCGNSRRIRYIFRADRVVGPYAAGFRFPVFRRGGRLCPPAGCTGFTVTFGEFDTSPWADVGISPYRVSANSYCPAGFKRKTFLTQLFKRNYLLICCTVTGGAYHSGSRRRLDENGLDGTSLRCLRSLFSCLGCI